MQKYFHHFAQRIATKNYFDFDRKIPVCISRATYTATALHRAHWGKAAWNRPRLEDPSQEGEVFHSTEHLPYFSFNTKTTASKKKKIYEL